MKLKVYLVAGFLILITVTFIAVINLQYYNNNLKFKTDNELEIAQVTFKYTNILGDINNKNI